MLCCMVDWDWQTGEDDGGGGTLRLEIGTSEVEGDEGRETLEPEAAATCSLFFWSGLIWEMIVLWWTSTN